MNDNQELHYYYYDQVNKHYVPRSNASAPRELVRPGSPLLEHSGSNYRLLGAKFWTASIQ